MQVDQRQHGVAHIGVQALATLACQVEGGLELDDRVVPFAGEEKRPPANHVMAGESPPQSELVADAPSDSKGPRCVVQAVEIHQDVPAAQVERIAMPGPARAAVGTLDRVVDLVQRLL